MLAIQTERPPAQATEGLELWATWGMNRKEKLEAKRLWRRLR